MIIDIPGPKKRVDFGGYGFWFHSMAQVLQKNHILIFVVRYSFHFRSNKAATELLYYRISK